MNLLLLYPAERTSQSELTNPASISIDFFVTGTRALELTREHELTLGISVLAGELSGMIGHATVTSLTDAEVRFTFTPEKAAPAKLALTLAVAYSRPQASKRVLQLASQSGVKAVHFFPISSGQKSYQQSGVFSPDEIHQQLALGLQQGCDTILPSVRLWEKFHEFAAWLESSAAPAKRFVADTTPQLATACSVEKKEEALFIVGSERGFNQNELKVLADRKCASLSLGDRILKVDVACAFLLGVYHAKVIL